MNTKKVMSAVCLSSLLYSSQGLAQNYQIEKKDTLSEIIQRTYPEKRIYGKKGALKKVLKLNPTIINPNKISAGQTINLGMSETVLTTPVRSENVNENAIEDTNENLSQKQDEIQDKKQDETPTLERPTIKRTFVGLGVGPRFFSYDQTGFLGNTKAKTSFFKNLEFFVGHTYNDFTAKLEVASYQISYSSGAKNGNDQLLKLAPTFYYKNFYMGAIYEERPLFLQVDDVASMLKDKNLSAAIGYRWKKDLATKVKTSFELEGEFNYLLSSSSERGLKNKDIKGHGFKIGTNLVRDLELRNFSFPLSYYWKNSVGYNQFEKNVRQEEDAGMLELKYFNAFSSIGLVSEF